MTFGEEHPHIEHNHRIIAAVAKLNAFGGEVVPVVRGEVVMVGFGNKLGMPEKDEPEVGKIVRWMQVFSFHGSHSCRSIEDAVKEFETLVDAALKRAKPEYRLRWRRDPQFITGHDFADSCFYYGVHCRADLMEREHESA